MEELGRPRRLVALQMSDEMPRRAQILNAEVLPFPLLHAVFTEMAHPLFIGLANGLRWMRLRNSDQSNISGTAAGSLRGGKNPLLHSHEVFPYRGRRHVRIEIVACAALQRCESAVRLAFAHDSTWKTHRHRGYRRQRQAHRSEERRVGK